MLVMPLRVTVPCTGPRAFPFPHTSPHRSSNGLPPPLGTALTVMLGSDNVIPDLIGAGQLGVAALPNTKEGSYENAGKVILPCLMKRRAATPGPDRAG